MLTNLHVKNFAIIDEADISFDGGFNVLTGETGAGKSLLIGSVNAALGGKFTKEMAGSYGDFALAEITFETKSDKVKEIFEANDLSFDDGEIVISRKVTSAGKSVSRINGETVSAKILKEVAQELIDLHGQHEHQSLLYKDGQRNIIDAFSAENEKALENVRIAYGQWRKALGILSETENSGRRSDHEIDLLTYEADEIRKAELRPGEDETLEERYRVLSSSDRILEETEAASAALSGGMGNVSDMVSRAAGELRRASALDKEIAECENSLDLIAEEISDVVYKLRSISEKYSGTEEEFGEVSERLDLINKFKSRYGKSIEEILAYAESAEEAVAKNSDLDGYIEKLRKDLSEKEAELKAACDVLRKARRKAAEALTGKINDALLELNFEHPAFEIHFEETGKYSEYGDEDVVFYFSANLGEDVKPLGKCASGGELSRVMLAIKSASAASFGTETLVFDEIDTGISGRTAQKAAEKMALISSERQVICITHLPQIAAMADCHYRIEKHEEGGRTRTEIVKLGIEEMTEELSRMLSGAEITESVMNNASEMKELAENIKKELRG